LFLLSSVPAEKVLEDLYDLEEYIEECEAADGFI
jgi:hypothetical protein